jgi:hypothetical protein
MTWSTCWGLVTSVLIGSIWFVSRPVARAAASVLVVLAALLLLPSLLIWFDADVVRISNRVLGIVAIVVPQLLNFAGILYREGGGAVLRHEWAAVVSVSFWLLAAVVFGLLARRVTAPLRLLGLAAAFVVAVVCAVLAIVPLFGWKLVFEGP